MIIGKDISLAGKIIREGGLVAFPTETVYGLGADVFNSRAVAKIFEIKERPSFDPLIVHICHLSQLDTLCKKNDKRIASLAEKFWPGPLTIVVEKNELVPDIVTAGLNTVGIRMPSHPFARRLISDSGTALAAPSANKFGLLSPTESSHVIKQLPQVDYLLDGGKSSIGIESTVIALNDEGYELLRPGAITSEDLSKILPVTGFHDKGRGKLSPGLLKSHYSPEKPVFIGQKGIKHEQLKQAGLICLQQPANPGLFKKVEVLSARGDLVEAASNLFSALHKMENADVDFIIVEKMPETGIGIAIMDRLYKAAYRYRNN